jgi:hypothetical protein
MTSVQSLAELSVLIHQVRQANESLEVGSITAALKTAVQAFREATDAILEANTPRP